MPELGCSNTRGLVALPNDILLKILDGLDPQSAVRFGQVRQHSLEQCSTTGLDSFHRYASVYMFSPLQGRRGLESLA